MSVSSSRGGEGGGAEGRMAPNDWAGLSTAQPLKCSFPSCWFLHTYIANSLVETLGVLM